MGMKDCGDRRPRQADWTVRRRLDSLPHKT